MGAGIVAAGPWECADTEPGTDPFEVASTVCSHTNLALPFRGPPNVKASIAATRAAARSMAIDPTSGLTLDRVFLFSGTEDSVVPQVVVDALKTYYQAFVAPAHIHYTNDINAQHAFPTEDYGNACDKLASPFINNCHFDGARAILRTIYGRLNPPGDPSYGRIIEFDQAEFLPAEPISMAPIGHVFVPAWCQYAPGCRLHVAFHGCLQDQAHVGDAFYAHAGYNRWAATNRIVVLYPQLVASADNPKNPTACWDWWGYTGAGFATRNGKQIVAVQKMIERISAMVRTEVSEDAPRFGNAGGAVARTTRH
jgi:hypothetical protein